MKQALAFLFTLVVCSLSAQIVTFSYSLDTTHSGGIARVDSFYLVETTIGSLIQSGQLVQTGGRSQTFANPIFFTDTASLTAYWVQLKQDSINLSERIASLRAQADILGAKYRAIWYVQDSVFSGYSGGPK